MRNTTGAAKVRRPKLKDFEGLLYILPWIIGFVWLQLYPFLTSLFYSFTDFNMMREPSWVGLQNYIRLLAVDPDFWPSLRVTAFYAFLVVPGKLLAALIVALALNMKLRAVNLYRTLYYLPSILGGSIAVSVLWKIMFMRSGLINGLLAPLGLGPVDWLGSPDLALFTISGLSIWQFGSSMVLFLAALKQIPRSLYEAAIVDGASKARSFFGITLPMISPILFFNLVMQLINALQEFTSAFVITDGGPMKSTYVLGIKLYKEAFQHYKMGYASAVSWVIFVLITLLAFAVFRSSSGWVYYEDGGNFT